VGGERRKRYDHRSVAAVGVWWKAWVLRLVETGINRPSRVIDVLDIRPRGGRGDIANV
jgi:hypothetical protein